MRSVPEVPGHVKALGPYSHVVVAGGSFAFVSAQAPLAPDAPPGEFVGKTIEEQTRQCLRNIERILGSLGLSLREVVRTTVYLRDPADFPRMNEAYAAYFPSEPPARAVARLGVEPVGMLVSIDAIAVYAPKTEE